MQNPKINLQEEKVHSTLQCGARCRVQRKALLLLSAVVRVQKRENFVLLLKISCLLGGAAARRKPWRCKDPRGDKLVRHRFRFVPSPLLMRARVFVVHKPVNVISATVDPQVTNVIRSTAHPRYGELVGGESRLTVYDIAEAKGFPRDCGLVGRLDCETSGIMMFSDDSRLASAIRDPVDENSPFYGSPFKVKEYVLQLTHPKGHDERNFSAASVEESLSAPFKFSRFGVEHSTSRADVKVLRVWRDEALSYGRSHLGWVIELRVALQEGKHHQIRRMARRGGYHVLSLRRTRIAGILDIDSIPTEGDCRWLTEDEIHTLYEGLGLLEKSSV